MTDDRTAAAPTTADRPRIPRDYGVPSNTGHNVVIMEGEAEFLEQGVDHATAQRLAAASNAKYPEYGVKASDYAGPGPFAIRPRVAFAWSSFPKDVTRFKFGEGAAPG